MLPTLNDDFEKKMFLIEMNYWGIEIEKNVSDLQEQLIAILKAPMENTVSELVKEQFTQMGPLDVEILLSNENMTINEIYKSGSLFFENIIWKGQVYIDEAHGLGRGYGQFGLYEGWYSNGLA